MRYSHCVDPMCGDLCFSVSVLLSYAFSRFICAYSHSIGCSQSLRNGRVAAGVILCTVYYSFRFLAQALQNVFVSVRTRLGF